MPLNENLIFGGSMSTCSSAANGAVSPQKQQSSPQTYLNQKSIENFKPTILTYTNFMPNNNNNNKQQNSPDDCDATTTTNSSVNICFK